MTDPRARPDPQASPGGDLDGDGAADERARRELDAVPPVEAPRAQALAKRGRVAHRRDASQMVDPVVVAPRMAVGHAPRRAGGGLAQASPPSAPRTALARCGGGLGPRASSGAPARRPRR